MLTNFGRSMAALNDNEDGHIGPVPGAVVTAVGAVLLGIGAANDTGGLAIVGGIVVGVGVLATSVMHHIKVEYGIFKRLDDLEAKK